VVLTALPENLLAGSIKESARFSGMLLLLSQILSIAIYMMVAKKLLNPVSLLVRSAEEFAGGKLSSRAPVVRNDEIGLIARSFNDMADTVSTLFINLEKSVEERTVQLQRANRELEEQTMQSMEAEKKLQLLLDSAGEAVYGVDRHGKCTFCNRSFLKILGFHSTDNLVGKEIHSLIHHSLEDGTPLDQSRCRICLAMSSGRESMRTTRCSGGRTERRWRLNTTHTPSFRKEKSSGRWSPSRTIRSGDGAGPKSTSSAPTTP
jgi:PAS domain S-box-containing protein